MTPNGGVFHLLCPTLGTAHTDASSSVLPLYAKREAIRGAMARESRAIAILGALLLTSQSVVSFVQVPQAFKTNGADVGRTVNDARSALNPTSSSRRGHASTALSMGAKSVGVSLI